MFTIGKFKQPAMNANVINRRQMYKATRRQNKVLCNGYKSTEFLMENGLKQGDPLSITFFNLLLENIIRSSKERKSQINGE